MIEIQKYEVEKKSEWNRFIQNSKNGLFLFNRDYMDYHSDRFRDSSFMFYKKGKLVGVMPASIHHDMLISHGGLTFGGIISDHSMKALLMLDIFKSLSEYANNNNCKKLIYKVIPHIYHSAPAEEDLYALFLNNAKLIRRDVSSTIDRDATVPFAELRRRCVKKAEKSGLGISRTNDFKQFMEIVTYVLKAYHNATPVHSSDEIKKLADKFPENIKLFAAYKKDVMLAGSIVYESVNVAHAQYIASTDEGKEVCASDLLFKHLIADYRSKKLIFDFGISTEKEGRFLNKGLVGYKEGFGARTIAYDFYELSF